jgi:EmrB/QacA subfamily drug resistance transporter
VVLAVILTSQLMVVLDSTIVNVALPHIQRSLHFSSTSLSWVLNAYILTFGGLLMLGARSGDLLGRRRVFLLGIGIFSVASLLGGFATESWMLLSSRALQGIGAAMAAPSSLALLTTIFPEGAARMRAIALFTTVSAAGAATGLVAGGILTELVSWRWVMFVNVPIGLAVLAIGRLTLVETERRHGRFDMAGAILSVLGMTGIVFGFVEAGSDGWGDPLTWGSLLVGAVLLVLFVHNESRVDEPILPLRLFAHSGRATANAARGLLYSGMFGMFFFATQFLQEAKGFSPMVAGVAFLPIPTSVFLGSQLTSRVLMRRMRPKAVMLSGAVLVIIALVLCTQLHASSPYLQMVVSLVLLGAGSGISLVSLTSAALEDVDPADAGAASGVVNVSQQVGAALGLAVLVTVFGSLTHHAQLLNASGRLINAHAQAVFIHALDFAFGTAAVFAVVAFVMVAVFIHSGPRMAAAPVDSVDSVDSVDDGDLAQLDRDLTLELVEL